MLAKNEAIQALQKLFRRRPVAEIDALFHTLATRSRMSVFRRLKEVDHLCSFTHAGRYYTLADIPLWDEHGLWFHQGIGFSRAGTLKETVAVDVGGSEAGRLHGELKRLLHVRVHNTLLGLVREGRIGREAFGRLHLYVSAEAERAAGQLARREELVQAAAEAAASLSSTLVIEVLVETLQAGDWAVAPSEVAARLTARGVLVSPEQVRAVFARCGLDAEKKTVGSPSPPSRR